MKRAFGLAALALVATLLLPVTASADSLDASGNGVLGDTVPLNTMLVFFAAVLVLFMQAGFALLEIGFSRSKNAGTGVAKILTNLSIAAIGSTRSASRSRSATARSWAPTASCSRASATRRTRSA